MSLVTELNSKLAAADSIYRFVEHGDGIYLHDIAGTVLSTEPEAGTAAELHDYADNLIEIERDNRGE